MFEVGLGGRFDATNALANIVVSTITNVDLDHMHLLGDTVAAIAFEKAGIIKSAPVVTAAEGDALAVIRQRAEMQGTPLLIVGAPGGAFGFDLFETFTVDIENAAADFAEPLQRKIASVRQRLFIEAKVTLAGAYQRLNALTAVVSLCASGFIKVEPPSEAPKIIANLGRGLELAHWPGRFEIDEARGLLLDGAHNPAGARALRLSLDEMFADKKRAFIFASFENKSLASVLLELLKDGDQVFCPKLEGERAFHKYEDINSICNGMGVSCFRCENFTRAVQEAASVIESDTSFAPLVVVTGSFATIRAAKEAK